MIDYSTKAFTMLLFISAYNALLGLLMVGQWVGVMMGMSLCFLGIGVMFGISVMVLMPGEKPWRKPKHPDKDEADYWNEIIRRDW